MNKIIIPLRPIYCLEHFLFSERFNCPTLFAIEFVGDLTEGLCALLANYVGKSSRNYYL